MLSTVGSGKEDKFVAKNEGSVDRYRFLPAAYTVSKANEDFPDPDTPVSRTISPGRNSMEIFFRFLTVIPEIRTGKLGIDLTIILEIRRNFLHG
ncbi:Uncharacterised protein [Chlamydia abortus]|nr:Uncharacterised protein [Chlamydia abortus]